MEKMTVLIVGIGGYGGVYLSELLHHPRGEQYRLVGAVDPYADRSKYAQELRERQIPIYETLEDFYRTGSAELAILATPIFLHAQQAEFCIAHGSHVLCEKPLCATIEDAVEMLAARSRYDRILGVGFQWCYSESALHLKRDLLSGVYGAIRRIRTLVFFPRNVDYYHRTSGWAGRRFMPSGERVFDCVASNATAHYLQNMLFLSGPALGQSCEPVSMEAEVYRINDIEMYDTCAFRIHTATGAELLFLASHAVPMASGRDPEYVLECERGTVELTGGQIVGHPESGQDILYGQPCPDTFRTLDAMQAAIRTGAELPCAADTALAHLRCVSTVAAAFPAVPRFAEPFCAYSEEDRQSFCIGLDEVLQRCYTQGLLPYETGAVWAQEPLLLQLGR